MRKKVLSLAVAVMALVSFGATAQTPDNSSKPATEQTASCCKNKDAKKEGHGCCKKDGKKAEGKHGCCKKAEGQQGCCKKDGKKAEGKKGCCKKGEGKHHQHGADHKDHK